MMEDMPFEIGTVRIYKGQTYTLVATEPYRRKRDGTETTLLVWESSCADYGHPFRIKTSRKKILAFNRRCRHHAKPGVRV